jgi:membrane protein YqaA with SNARE-associated domain
MFSPTVASNGHSGASRSQPAWVNALTGMPGLALAFLWGLAEGTFFFVVPDVPISLAAILNPRRAWRHILAAIVGSVIGGMLLFSWSSRDPRGAQDAVARVPFVTSGMFAEVHASYRAHGLGALFLGPLFGTPYKIYAVEAPGFLGWKAFMLATAPARGERFLVVWAGFGVVGTLLRRFRGRTAPQLALLNGSFWVVLYAVYWGMIVFR